MDSPVFFSGLKTLGISTAAIFYMASPVSGQQEKPNILWITSEDNSPFLGCYGDSRANTPNLDAFAEEGIVYEHAFANVPVSAPARYSIITGMYASSTGNHHMRSNNLIPERFHFFPHYLREAGYYCTNHVKEDYNLDKKMWEEKASHAWNESSRQAHYAKRENGQPFFAVFNTTLSHEHKIHYHLLKERGDFQHNPDSMNVAPYHPDTPEMRENYAQYYDYITRMDERVGELLDELEEKGLAENTIVFYYSDHGGVLPRSKRYLFESGTRVPFIVRFPEKYKHLAPGNPGSRNNRLISFVDLAPTILSIAGIEAPNNMEGKAFLGEYKTENPEYVHFFRGRMDERYDMMRGVRTHQYRYIRNYMPHRIYGQHLWYLWRSSATREWEKEYKNDRCNLVQSRFWNTKPTEELYDISKDPHNIHNLASDPEYKEVLKRMRRENKRWIRSRKDAGFIPEGMMNKLASNHGVPVYDLTHQPGFPIEEIISTAELASQQDPDNREQLSEMLSDTIPAVRYWAALGCAMLEKKASNAKPGLTHLLNDPYGDVRIAAAEALCRMGENQRAYQVLVESINHNNQWVQLRALNVMQSLNDVPEPFVKEIMSITPWKKRDEYFKKAYSKLLKTIVPEWENYIIW